MPSFSSTLSLILSTLSVGSISISIWNFIQKMRIKLGEKMRVFQFCYYVVNRVIYWILRDKLSVWLAWLVSCPPAHVLLFCENIWITSFPVSVWNEKIVVLGESHHCLKILMSVHKYLDFDQHFCWVFLVSSAKSLHCLMPTNFNAECVAFDDIKKLGTWDGKLGGFYWVTAAPRAFGLPSVDN